MGRSSNGSVGELAYLIFLGACALAMQPAGAAIVPVDLSGYNAASPVDVAVSGSLLNVTWYDSGTPCQVQLNLDPALPILNEIRYGTSLLAQNVTIRYYVTEGSRSAGSPGENYIFFDNPSARPYTQNTSTLNLTLARVSSSGNRVAITLSALSAGSFTGNLVLNFYDQSPLFLLEAAMAQPNDLKAYYYGATLASSSFSTFAWMNTSGTIVRETPTGTSYKNKAVRHRTIMAESAAGTLSVFPPPHSFFFPRNNTQNLSFTKIGLNKFGIRQATTGGGAYSPWFDAPAGRTQRMPMFVHLSGGNTATALSQVKAYTHNDTFKPMSGRITFSSHFHPDLTYPWMQGDHTPITNFKTVLKGMGVNVVQSAEFHAELLDKYGANRLSHLDAYFNSSREYSDSQFLIIPSEEGNGSKDHLISHWMQLFPKPVYFTWTRNAGQPFSETLAPYGTVYHVGSQTDLLNLFAAEQAVAWTAHPRIKASYTSPDDYKTQSWYRSGTWLGGAWKAMPGDLSRPLGMRVFKLLDDMNNWGQVKYTHGEVDFYCDGHPVSPPGERMDSTHEVYGHMNINYLAVPTVPSFNNGWTSVVNALKTGNYFTSTGEILIHSWSVTGSTLTGDIEWTFPLARAEIVTSNGTVATRTTVGLPSTREFGRQTFSWSIPAGTSWARLEVSDVARNVAYTQPKRIL